MSQPITRFGPDATATTVPPLSLYGLNWDIISKMCSGLFEVGWGAAGIFRGVLGIGVGVCVGFFSGGLGMHMVELWRDLVF